MSRKILIFVALAFGACTPHTKPTPTDTQLCEKTIEAYGPLRDEGPADTFADLFAEDGEFHLAGNITKGRDALIARHIASNAETIWRHNMNGSRIVENENTVSGTTRFHIFAGPRTSSPTAPARELIGDYLDEFTIEDGACKIKSRKVKIVFDRLN
jgi:hypothetical protein